MRVYTAVVIAALLCAGCKSPFNSTRDASGAGPTGQFGQSGTLVVFSSELQTGGGAFEYPGGENQTLTFTDTSNPISHRSIRYNWNGQPAVAGSSDATFAGFDLMYTTTQSAYNPSPSVPGRDLSKAGYTKVTFYARGTLSTNTDLKIEVADDGVTTTPDPCMTLSTSGTAEHCNDIVADPIASAPKPLTSSWQQYTITVPNSALTNVKDFFKATFVFTPGIGSPTGQGGTVYFDQIQYQAM